MRDRCDVLVIGAGPAGCGAARAAAAGGADVLMIDRKREIGTPVQCGEVIGRSLFKMIDLDLPQGIVCGEQDFTRFILNRSIQVDNHSDYWASLTVERKMLDKHLAEMAGREGAGVQADTRLVSLVREEGVVRKAHLSHRGQRISIRPRMVIAADGVHSTVSRLLDFAVYPPDEVARGIEFEMLSREPLPRCMQIFLEQEIGLGYGWIIPKGERRANVGLGIVGADSGRDLLTRWIRSNPVIARLFDGEAVLEIKRGEAPVAGFRGGPRSGNVLFAGDSAGQTLAFVGEGIAPSYICGEMAGRAAAEALDDISGLEAYDQMVRKTLGEELGAGARTKDLIVRIWMRPDISQKDKVLLCGLLMNECLTGEEAFRLTREEISSLDPFDIIKHLDANVEIERMD